MFKRQEENVEGRYVRRSKRKTEKETGKDMHDDNVRCEMLKEKCLELNQRNQTGEDEERERKKKEMVDEG